LWDLGGVAGLEISGAPFLLHEVNPSNPTETSPDRARVTSTRIEMFVDGPDSLIERAIAAGATAGAGIEDPVRLGEATVKVASGIRSATTGL
jgi:PhnB protein